MTDKFVSIDWESMIYPTPKERVENPIGTRLSSGDIVRINVGPARGKIGIVVVERNGNYVDSEPYCDDESIGVKVAEETPEDPTIKAIVDRLTSRDNSIRTVVRWFDNDEQLTLMQSAR